MTTDQKVKWEQIDSLEQLKLGDEIEYIRTTDHSEFKNWGKVIHVQKHDVHVSGDWHLVPSSLDPYGYKAVLKRKVVSFVWPKYIGACVEATKDGSVFHYVRVAESGPNEWVLATTGEYFATWELDLISANYKHRVLGRGY